MVDVQPPTKKESLQMAKAPGLIPGFTYRINQGMFEGDTVVIVSNTPIPDGEENQRKVLVQHSEGEMFILPRMLDDTPVTGPGTGAVAVFDRTAETALLNPVTVAAPPIVIVQDAIIPITDPMDPRLDHLRPSRSRVRRYMSREMPNGMSDIDFLLTFTNDEYRAENEMRPANIMLKGDTQSGKTILVEVLAIAWADKLGLPKPMPIFTLSGSSGITDYDLFGQTTTYQDRLVFLPGVADLAARVGGILYIDEANAIGERVTSSLHPLADSRHHFVNRNKPVEKGGVIMPEVVSESLDLWIIGTYNEGYRGMGEMNEAFLNRFRHLTWGYNDKVEEKLVGSAAIRLLGELLRTARGKGVLRTPVGTSALQKCVADCVTFGPEMGLSIFLGLFKPQERAQVEDIINDKAIIVLFNEELKVHAHA